MNKLNQVLRVSILLGLTYVSLYTALTCLSILLKTYNLGAY